MNHRHRIIGALREGYFHGPGMRAAKMLSADDLQLIILALLSQSPRHGYEIIKSLQEHSSGLYTPSPGVVYPALTYLEEAGLLTQAGTDYLATHRATADALIAQLERLGQKMAQFQRQYVEEELTGEEWGGSARDQEKMEWRQIKAQFHELKHEFKAALYEKLHASIEEKRRVLEILRRAIVDIRG